jgi:hypothetical protein
VVCRHRCRHITTQQTTKPISIMKKIFLLAVCLLMSASLFAQVTSTTSSETAPKTLLKAGDFHIGPRLALGSVAGASLGFGAAAEFGLQENIGLGAFVGYSSYSQAIPLFGDWSYKNILILATGSYHYDFLKSDKIDTFGEIGLGYNVGSVSYSGATALPAAALTPTVGGFVYTITANARYFFSPSLSLFGSVGYGLGIARVGLDFKM